MCFRSVLTSIIFQIVLMPTILEQLQAEQQAQREEEARSPFRSVEAIRAFITDSKPSLTENISVEMCVLAVTETQKCWRLELIDRDLETQFDDIMNAYEPLDVSRRGKYIFQLSLWKSRNRDVNDCNYCAGFSYKFSKVHSLKLMYENPVGSIQIRNRLLPSALPPLGAYAVSSGTRNIRCAGRDDNDGGNAITTPISPSHQVASSDSADANNGRDNGGPESASKPSLKRKLRKSDTSKEASVESPNKKARSAMGA